MVLLLTDCTVEKPEEINVPPQKPLYQYQLAELPRIPPETLNVDEEPGQTGDVPETERG